MERARYRAHPGKQDNTSSSVAPLTCRASEQQAVVLSSMLSGRERMMTQSTVVNKRYGSG